MEKMQKKDVLDFQMKQDDASIQLEIRKERLFLLWHVQRRSVKVLKDFLRSHKKRGEISFIGFTKQTC